MSKIKTKWLYDGSITEQKISSTVAGEGLSGGDGTPLKVLLGTGLSLGGDGRLNVVNTVDTSGLGTNFKFINIDEHLQVGDIMETPQDGMMWYDETENVFNFRENGESRTFETLIDEHIMKAMETQVKVHSSNKNITYVGEAEPGSVTSGAVWRIKEIVEDGNDISVQWADGNGNFDNIFDNRESLSYT
jgi:hypothetical protein